MIRTMTAAVLCGAAVLLAGCGGGGGGGPAGKMKEAMKACDAANKDVPDTLRNAKAGKLSAHDARLEADAGVAACESALAAWEQMTDMPPQATEACVAEARAKVELAVAHRVALDHQQSTPYKLRIDRATLAVEKAVDACKEAQKAKPPEAAQ